MTYKQAEELYRAKFTRASANQDPQQSTFDRFMEFIRTRGVERTVDQPIRNVQVADRFSDLPVQVQKFDARGRLLRFLDTHFSEHAAAVRLPGGYHIVTRISGGPAFVHFDAIDPLISNTATLLHIYYEGFPGALPVEYIPSSERFAP